ncbi:MAG: hypothetical protein EOM68_27895 [Spirochaetia bacterium]|nr:hypothetical protein [Spirochaetia bacterium]
MWLKRFSILLLCLVLAVSSVGAWNFSGKAKAQVPDQSELVAQLQASNASLQTALNAKDSDLALALKALAEAKKTLESLQSNLAESRTSYEQALAEVQRMKELLAEQKSLGISFSGGALYDFSTIKPTLDIGLTMGRLTFGVGAVLAPDWDDLVNIDNLVPTAYQVRAGFSF